MSTHPSSSQDGTPTPTLPHGVTISPEENARRLLTVYDRHEALESAERQAKSWAHIGNADRTSYWERVIAILSAPTPSSETPQAEPYFRCRVCGLFGCIGCPKGTFSGEPTPEWWEDARPETVAASAAALLAFVTKHAARTLDELPHLRHVHQLVAAVETLRKAAPESPAVAPSAAPDERLRELALEAPDWRTDAIKWLIEVPRFDGPELRFDGAEFWKGRIDERLADSSEDEWSACFTRDSGEAVRFDTEAEARGAMEELIRVLPPSRNEWMRANAYVAEHVWLAPSAERTLMALAEAATPGPWIVDDRGNGPVVESRAYEDEEPGICGSHSRDWPLVDYDAAYIAACSPDVILALLSERDSLRSEIAALRGNYAQSLSNASEQIAELLHDRAALREDKADLDWMQDRVDGTGETLSFGGVCSWGLDIQSGGPRSKATRLGSGDDLRSAIRAARSEKPTP